MADLAPGQLEVDGLLLGHGSQYIVTSWPDAGTPDIADQDTRPPNNDGVIFGEDHAGGIVLPVEFTVNTRTLVDARQARAAAQATWRNVPSRRRPRQTVVMRWRHFDGPTLRVWGRPRRFEPTNSGLMNRGRVDLVADFQAVDDLFYADQPVSIDTGLYGQTTAGYVLPWTFPLAAASTPTESSAFLNNPGDVDTRMVEVSFTGPVTNPGVRIPDVGTVYSRRSYAPGQTGTLTLHPALRSARLDSGADISGTVDGDVDGFALPPGRSQVQLVAQNLVGQARMRVTAWPAYTSI